MMDESYRQDSLLHNYNEPYILILRSAKETHGISFSFVDIIHRCSGSFHAVDRVS